MEEKLELMPPSCFSAPSQTDPWKALSEATKEIIALKDQNRSLAKSRSVPKEEEKHDVRQHTLASSQQISFDPRALYGNLSVPPYHDSIINRQASEIESLKFKLQQTDSDHIKTVSALEHRLSLQATQSDQLVKTLKDEVTCLQDQLLGKKQDMKRLEDNHADVVKELESRFDEEREQYQTQHRQHESQSTKQIEDLNIKLQRVLEEHKNKTQNYEEKIHWLESSLQQEKEESSKLRTYLNEADGLTQTSTALKQHTNQLNNKIQGLEEEKRHLASTLELLNIRLHSQQEILTLHEDQLSKLPGSKTEKQTSVLLTRWREKVYELMVKLRCSELVYADEMRKLKNKLADSEDALKTCHFENRRLQLALDDKQAQLDMELQRTKALEGNVLHAQQIAVNLDDEAERDLLTVAKLKQFTDSVLAESKSSEEKLGAALTKLHKYSQRIDFACGRLHMLQGQFARREAMLRLEHTTTEEHGLSSQADVCLAPVRDNDIVGQLEEELGQVRQERDVLVAQMKTDASFLQKKIGQATQKSAEEAEHLQRQLIAVHCEMDNQAQELNQQIEVLREENKHMSETVDDLKQQLEAAEAETEKRVAEERQRMEEQVSEMQCQVNDARREHTKAVVSVRQTERRHQRELERAKKDEDEMRQSHAATVTRLETKLQQLQKSKNIMQATLQQEGLLGKVRGARGTVIHLSDSGSEEESKVTSVINQTPVMQHPVDNLQAVPVVQQTAEPQQSEQSKEPLHCVIDELKHLTEAVMQDTDDSDSEEDPFDKEPHLE